MAFEFDHLFICTDIGADEADRLVSAGLVEGSSNIHLGQGTANRRFFFHNAMVEFLWVHNREEAMSEQIRRTRLWERWQNRDRGACPFGICLRPTAESTDTIAFPSWAYQPPYLPETMSFAVGHNSDVLAEPMLLQTPFGQRPDHYSAEKAQPLNHALGIQEITRVEIITPSGNNPSAALQSVIATHQVALRLGTEYCIELGFDGETQARQIDFRPKLPLVMSW
jgi:hypothetical protein